MKFGFDNCVDENSDLVVAMKVMLSEKVFYIDSENLTLSPEVSCGSNGRRRLIEIVDFDTTILTNDSTLSNALEQLISNTNEMKISVSNALDSANLDAAFVLNTIPEITPEKH
eukprot:UN05593